MHDLMNWLASGERGESSNTMVTHLTGMNAHRRGGRNTEPWDADDLSRCRKLLEEVPELLPLLPKMATCSGPWAQLGLNYAGQAATCWNCLKLPTKRWPGRSSWRCSMPAASEVERSSQPDQGGVMPERVQLSRAKGWRMPENTVKVDRTSRYGNPFRDSEHDRHGEASIGLANGMRQIVDDWWTAQIVVGLFEQWLTGALIQEPSFLEPRELVARKRLRPVPDLAPLRGMNLACWCKPGAACHADVLLRLANDEPPNVAFSGVPAGHSSNHPAGGTSAGTQG